LRPLDTHLVDRLSFQGVLGTKRAILVLLVLATIDFAACRRPSHSADPQPNPSDRIPASTTTRSNNLFQLETMERRAIGVVSPQQLYDEYSRSQFAAESNYDGQFVKVVGPLIGIRRDSLDAAVLRLGLGPTYAPGAAIDARFNREDEGPLKDLQLDQVVAIIGSPRYDATDGLVLLRCMIAPRE
jgi:putative nucleic acid binding protein